MRKRRLFFHTERLLLCASATQRGVCGIMFAITGARTGQKDLYLDEERTNRCDRQKRGDGRWRQTKQNTIEGERIMEDGDQREREKGTKPLRL